MPLIAPKISAPSKILKAFQALISVIYRLAYLSHRRLFLKPKEALKHSKLIVVGSFLAGGAGKTPFSLYLAKQILQQQKTLAILCHSKARDEQRWLQKKLPGCPVYHTKNRHQQAKKIDGQFDIILCDDGFEDSRLAPDLKIALRWGEQAQSIFELIPRGHCRSLEKDHSNIHLSLLCGLAFQNPDIEFQISTITNSQHQKLQKPAIAMCGIGNPDRFFKDLQKHGISLIDKIKRKDHDTRFEIHLQKTLLKQQPIIITEKDYHRLGLQTQKNPLLYVAPQKIKVHPHIALERVLQQILQ